MSLAGDGNVLVLASASGSLSMPSASGPIAAQSYETTDQRVHMVTVDGQTYRAATPLDGPASRIVFDPVRRRFVGLLPSIRVELDGAVDLGALAASLGGVRVMALEPLGFAIVELPASLHPALALGTLASLRPAGGAMPPGSAATTRGTSVRERPLVSGKERTRSKLGIVYARVASLGAGRAGASPDLPADPIRREGCPRGSRQAYPGPFAERRLRFRPSVKNCR